jgi:cell division protein FtsB
MTAANSPHKTAHLAPSNLTPTRRTGRILLLLFIALAGIFIYGYVQRANRMAQIDIQIRQMEQRIADAHRERAVLEAELRYVATDDYLDRVAREELGMAKPGETALVVLDAPSPVAQVRPSSSAVSELPPDLTNRTLRPSPWLDWLDLFRLAPRN